MADISKLVIVFSLILVFFVSFSHITAQNEGEELELEVTAMHYRVEISTLTQINFNLDISLRNLSNEAILGLIVELNEKLFEIEVLVNNINAASSNRIVSERSILEIVAINSIQPDEEFNVSIKGKVELNIQEVETDVYQVFFNYNSNLESSDIIVDFILPKSYYLRLEDGQNNIIPMTNEFYSDGETIGIRWSNLSNIANQNTVIFLQFTGNPIEDGSQRSQGYMWLWSIIGVITTVCLGLGWLSYMNYKKYHSERLIDKTETRIIKTIKPVIINQREQEILELIKSFPEGISQSEITHAVDMSNVRLSQILSHLEDLKLIVKFKEGRGNKIYVNDDLEL
jgi:hypothetical protein